MPGIRIDEGRRSERRPECQDTANTGENLMAAPTAQNNWRACTKCLCLWWNGQPTNGHCPAGGAHSAVSSPGDAGGTSWDYVVIADPVPYPAAE
jgi:hypothetical protein